MSTQSNRQSLASSWDSLDFDAGRTRSFRTELGDIRLALDFVTNNLLTQQYQISREFEERVRGVYDDVINDIDTIRLKVNSLGDLLVPAEKFRSWVPMAPIRKECLRSIYEIDRPRKLKSSKSVDFVDVKDNEKVFVKYLDRHRSLGSSRTSISSITSTGSRCNNVPGYGCCFKSEQCDTSTYVQRPKNPRHSWGPSRSGSRSDLEEPNGCHDDGDESSDDWRMKVAPYMWEGWSAPGLNRDHLSDLRARLTKVEEIRQQIISIHNEYRQRHGCPDLSENEELSRDAQQWAEVTASRGYAQYSDSKSRGENILVTDISQKLTGRDIVDTWYRQSRNYNYKMARWQRGTSNFTQMIWKSSRKIGVGMAKFESHDTFVIVVQYWPPGNNNQTGQFRYNVPVPLLLPVTNKATKEMVTSDRDIPLANKPLKTIPVDSISATGRETAIDSKRFPAKDAGREICSVDQGEDGDKDNELDDVVFENTKLMKESQIPAHISLDNEVIESNDDPNKGASETPKREATWRDVYNKSLIDVINGTDTVNGITDDVRSPTESLYAELEDKQNSDYNTFDSKSRNHSNNSSNYRPKDNVNVHKKGLEILDDAAERVDVTDQVTDEINNQDVYDAASEAYKSPVAQASFHIQCQPTDGSDINKKPSVISTNTVDSEADLFGEPLNGPCQSESIFKIIDAEYLPDVAVIGRYDYDIGGDMDMELIDNLLEKLVSDDSGATATAKRTSYQTQRKTIDQLDESVACEETK